MALETTNKLEIFKKYLKAGLVFAQKSKKKLIFFVVKMFVFEVLFILWK